MRFFKEVNVTGLHYFIEREGEDLLHIKVGNGSVHINAVSWSVNNVAFRKALTPCLEEEALRALRMAHAELKLNELLTKGLE